MPEYLIQFMNSKNPGLFHNRVKITAPCAHEAEIIARQHEHSNGDAIDISRVPDATTNSENPRSRLEPFAPMYFGNSYL